MPWNHEASALLLATALFELRVRMYHHLEFLTKHVQELYDHAEWLIAQRLSNVLPDGLRGNRRMAIRLPSTRSISDWR